MVRVSRWDISRLCFQGVRGSSWDGFLRGEGAQPGVFWVIGECSPGCQEDRRSLPGLSRDRGHLRLALRGHGARSSTTSSRGRKRLFPPAQWYGRHPRSHGDDAAPASACHWLPLPSGAGQVETLPNRKPGRSRGPAPRVRVWRALPAWRARAEAAAMASGGSHGSRSPSPAERRPPPFPEHRGLGPPDSDSEGEDIFTGGVSAAAGGAPPRGAAGPGPCARGCPGHPSGLVKIVRNTRKSPS